MTIHTPIPSRRIVAAGGPVSRALAIMAAADPELARIRELRRSIAERIEADIALLDALDGDPDLEANGDDEPSLGSPCVSLFSIDKRERRTKAMSALPGERFAVGATDDCEDDDSEGPEGDDEREPDVDDEPALCGITVNSLFGEIAATTGYGEDEPSLGSLGGTAAGCDGSQADWSKGDRRDREVDTGSRTHNKQRENRFSYDPESALTKAKTDVRKRQDAAERARYGMRPDGELVRVNGRTALHVGRFW